MGLRETTTHMKPTLAIPVLATSNPTPAGPPELVGVNNSLLSLANLALSSPLVARDVSARSRPRSGTQSKDKPESSPQRKSRPRHDLLEREFELRISLLLTDADL